MLSSQVPVAQNEAAAPTAGTLGIRQATALGYVQAVCPQVPGRTRCLAYKVTNAGLAALGYRTVQSGTAASPVPGYGPADLQSAYKFTSSGGSGKTVAVVEEGDYPTLAADLAVYRSHFGLTSCTVSSGCLRVVNQNGTSSLPPPDLGWAGETALDVDMVSAVCPKCKILVVEATEDFTYENQEINLATAENTAARLKAVAISNSYGNEETSDELQAFAPAYQHSGVAITAATGDSSINSVQPAVFASVIGVGGTTLSRAPGTSRGWTEGAWNGATGFCAQTDPGVVEPSWQMRHGVTICNGLRAAGDVAFDADTNTGVAVYNQGWSVMGGTSVGAPAIASLYALAGTGRDTASSMYTKSSSLFDITGPSVSGCQSIVCQAGPGWDGPTGNGTPNGLEAFY
jgi:subtilase family serine protease